MALFTGLLFLLVVANRLLTEKLRGVSFQVLEFHFLELLRRYLAEPMVKVKLSVLKLIDNGALLAAYPSLLFLSTSLSLFLFFYFSFFFPSPSLSLSLDFSLEEVYIFREDVSRVLGGGRVGGGGVILVVLVLVLVLLFLLFLVLLLVEEVGLLRG